jgi:hypothetical protein
VKGLNELLQEIKTFVEGFTVKTVYSRLKKVVFNKEYGVQLGEFNVALSDYAHDLNIAHLIDEDNRRDEDLEVIIFIIALTST